MYKQTKEKKMEKWKTDRINQTIKENELVIANLKKRDVENPYADGLICAYEQSTAKLMEMKS
jgi:hypothetical protein